MKSIPIYVTFFDAGFKLKIILPYLPTSLLAFGRKIEKDIS
jgi:hypothetical protein